MNILKRIHCDNLFMPCRLAKLKAARNKVMSIFQLNSKRKAERIELLSRL